MKLHRLIDRLLYGPAKVSRERAAWEARVEHLPDGTILAVADDDEQREFRELSAAEEWMDLKQNQVPDGRKGSVR